MERIIVSLTTYYRRIANVPVVFDTVYAQTVKPDLVVLNLAYDEVVPENVQKYIDEHGIEVNRMADTKVYKKLIPTLKKYPEDCVISIDDDRILPPGMFEDFISVHKQYPGYPVSGNRYMAYGFQCHCGNASLTKAEYFGKYLDRILDDDIIANCPNDDVTYTYFANKNGRPYIRTKEEYFDNLPPYNPGKGYSNSFKFDPVAATFEYLLKNEGKLPFPNLELYEDYCDQRIMQSDIMESYIEMGRCEGRSEVKSSLTYRFGYFFSSPFIHLAHYFRSKKH